jgi:hypothetical protein
MFDGFTRQAPFTVQPPVATFECMDAALAYGSLKIAYNLPPGSLRTRGSVLREILEAYGVPVFSIDLGPNDGGILFKPITEGGTSPLLEWVSNFIGPCGARLLPFRRGRLRIGRIDPDEPSVRTLRAMDMKSLTVTPPATNDSNAVEVSSTVFGYIGPTGRRTVVERKPIFGAYAPKVAASKQDHTDGSVAALDLISVSAFRLISETITTTEYDGNTVIGQTVERFGWYARKGCVQFQPNLGSPGFNPYTDVYLFEDGTWRAEPQEVFQKLETTVRARTFNEAGFLNNETINVYALARQAVPLEIVHDTDDPPSASIAFIDENGDGWFSFPNASDDYVTFTGFLTFGGGEVMTWVSGEFITSFADDLNRITSTERLRLTTLLIDHYDYIGVTPIPSDGLSFEQHAFGPPSRRFYLRPRFVTTEPWISRDLTAYVNVTEESYDVAHTFTEYPSRYTLGELRETKSPVRTVAGSPPLREQLASYQTAQAAFASVTDSVRVGLVGEEIKDSQQNDYCETLGELHRVAFEDLRLLSAMRIQVETRVDWTMAEGKNVTIIHPTLNAGLPVKAYVWSLSWSVNIATGENSQSASCLYFPPELAAIAA